LDEMRARGTRLLALADAAERPEPGRPARRPSPRPPVQLRPKSLSLTEVETLIRDPYAIYARHLLRLRPLNPLRPEADAKLRGTVLHGVMERLLKGGALPEDPALAAARLMEICDTVLAESVPFPVERAAWRARMARIARPLVEGLSKEGGTPVLLEEKHGVEVPGLGFRLVGKPDRIDLLPDGGLRIVDYKTGKPPSPRQQEHFAKQLLLASVMASLGSFPGLEGNPVREIVYQGLGGGLPRAATAVDDALIGKALEEFRALIRAWQNPQRGYTARRAVFDLKWPGDYDDLARHGEWDATQDPWPEDVG
jgi:RecB family exonuclease